MSDIFYKKNDSKLQLYEKKNDKYVLIECNDGTYIEFLIKKEIYKTHSEYQEIVLLDTFEFGLCLFLDGVIQSCAKYHKVYDKEILRHVNINTDSLLILGGGDGNVLHMALGINPQINVTIVEIDREMINVSNKYIYNSMFNNKNINIIIDDAFNFLKSALANKYEQIIIDLTDQPIGMNCEELIDQYLSAIKYSLKRSYSNSYVSAYIGCDINIAEEIIRQINYKCELEILKIPSFGELCYVIHIQNINKKKGNQNERSINRS